MDIVAVVILFLIVISIGLAIYFSTRPETCIINNTKTLPKEGVEETVQEPSWYETHKEEVDKYNKIIDKLTKNAERGDLKVEGGAPKTNSLLGWGGYYDIAFKGLCDDTVITIKLSRSNISGYYIKVFLTTDASTEDAEANVIFKLEGDEDEVWGYDRLFFKATSLYDRLEQQNRDDTLENWLGG